jgi:hypothetical protein
MDFIPKGRFVLVLLTGGYVSMLGHLRDQAERVSRESEASRTGLRAQTELADYRGRVRAQSPEAGAPFDSGDRLEATPAGHPKNFTIDPTDAPVSSRRELRIPDRRMKRYGLR